eukprot:COSAG06_NODE_1691_length_8705_cov_95.509877_1_plen_104_part_10
MLWTWQYRWMDKGMKLWCGETAGRRHAVEHVSSRQPAASSQLLRDDQTGPPRHAGGFGGAALQADGRPPFSRGVARKSGRLGVPSFDCMQIRVADSQSRTPGWV